MENTLSHIKPPEVLFKYCREDDKWAYNNLRQRVIHFSAHHAFNDPYDFLIPLSLRNLTDEQFALLREKRPDMFEHAPKGKVAFVAHYNQIFENNQKHFREVYMFSCFSARHDNLVMWSLYANHGKGFCLGFDTNPGKSPVFKMPAMMQYRKKLPDASDAVNVLTGVHKAGGYYEGVLAHKAEEWKHEEEWRLIHGYRQIHNDVVFTMDPNRCYDRGSLKSVFFGTRTSTKTKELVRAIIEKEYRHVQMWQGELDDDEYKVKFDKPYP